jgi:flagellar hook-associated protein 3 FlgL
MSMRVTPTSMNRSVMTGLQGNLARLQRTQEQLSSGRRISRASDSPTDAAAAMRLRGEQARTEQLGRNVDDGLTWLGSADSTLTQATSILLRVRQQLVAGKNDTNGPNERAALAGEIDELGASLVGLANTTYLGRPVFAGTQNVGAAFDTTTGDYLGNGDAVQRNVSADGAGQVGVTLPGPEVFSTLFKGAGTDPGVLKRISAALRAGDPAAMDKALADLDQASQTMQSAHSLVGSRYNRLLGIQSKGEARLDTLTANLATAESIDLPKTIIDMQIQQTTYQAALGATAKIIQPSLVDFLR